MNREMTKALLKEAGGQTKVADSLGISKQAISQWDVVPSNQVLAVSASCGYTVTPHRWRPDLYPHPDDGLPDGMRGRTT